MKRAASHGADFVEFDVQLTKDLVPVLYHDFHVCIAMKRKKQLEDHDMLELPVKDLTLEQLHLLKASKNKFICVIEMWGKIILHGMFSYLYMYE